jgi:hypothetical protein
MQLKDFENHYDIENPFVDNILYAQKKTVFENNISLKTFIDLSFFDRIRDKDLCIIFLFTAS